MTGALGLTRTQCALLHACCLPLVMSLDANSFELQIFLLPCSPKSKNTIKGPPQFVFSTFPWWGLSLEGQTRRKTDSFKCQFQVRLHCLLSWMSPFGNTSDSPIDLRPRFHAIDYVDQISSQSSAVNRRAKSLVKTWHIISSILVLLLEELIKPPITENLYTYSKGFPIKPSCLGLLWKKDILPTSWYITF